MMRTQVVWQALREPGLEHVIVDGTDGWRADGSGIAVHDGLPVRFAYKLVTGVGGGVEHCDLTVNDTPLAVPLHGTEDLDISFTPLTNTLPIRRYRLAVGERKELDVVYVDVATTTIQRRWQCYTRLDTRTYRYESQGFSAVLAVDDEDLVEDYPGLWRRNPIRHP
ncbi:putative glycolipid-binding domain-containing protein [Hamadaea tsunoensis]|uniref:putative glycolipid-binding domain-containing protein n=1 Tax=Hamadaea tsunoensis TaxID=53368 RepID=UPI0003FDD14D|nr:putative glycolipid-binding domain-containing protein [Hamadaea tsunoensis]